MDRELDQLLPQCQRAAKVLDLAPAEGMEIEFRSDLNDKIIEVVGKKGLTHSDVARLAHT